MGVLNINTPLTLFTVWVGVSTMFSEDISLAVFGHPTRWQGLVSYISYAVLFTFVANMLDYKYTKRVLKYLFISAAVISVYSLINYYGFDPVNIPLQAIWGARANPAVVRATLGNRNTGGAYFALLMLPAVFLYLKSDSRKKSILMYLASLVFYIGLIASLTRVAWLGVIAAFMFSLWFLRKDFKKYIKKLGIIAASFIIVLLILDFTGGGQITGRYTNFVDQVSEIREKGDLAQFGSFRFFVYKKAVKAALDHPVAGVGPDCFVYYGVISDEEYEENPGLGNLGYFDKVHSEYLEFAATMGIPSLIFYLWFILSIFIPWLKKEKKMTPEVLAMFSGWTAYLAQAAFNFGAISVLPVFFVFSALLQKYLSYSEVDHENKNMDIEDNKTQETSEVDNLSLT